MVTSTGSGSVTTVPTWMPTWGRPSMTSGVTDARVLLAVAADEERDRFASGAASTASATAAVSSTTWSSTFRITSPSFSSPSAGAPWYDTGDDRAR